jgi:hypothetical protein
MSLCWAPLCWVSWRQEYTHMWILLCASLCIKQTRSLSLPLAHIERERERVCVCVRERESERAKVRIRNTQDRKWRVYGGNLVVPQAACVTHTHTHTHTDSERERESAFALPCLRWEPTINGSRMCVVRWLQNEKNRLKKREGGGGGAPRHSAYHTQENDIQHIDTQHNVVLSVDFEMVMPVFVGHAECHYSGCRERRRERAMRHSAYRHLS